MVITERYDSGRFMSEDFPFAVLRIVHDAMNTPKPHSHDFVELVFVERGSARHLFEGESYDLNAGDVFIINPGESHTFELNPGEKLQIINCLFQPHLIQESILRELAGSDLMDYFYIHPFLNPSERFNHILRLHGGEAACILSVLETMGNELEQRSVGYQTLIRIRMIELLMLLSRYYQLNHGPARLTPAAQRKVLGQRIGGYLERHYQQKITLHSLAALFNISTRQLNRIVREEFGTSVVERIHQIRIEKAKLFLTQTDEKVITVAGMVGYEDPAFFSLLFTRKVGYPPGRFRAITQCDGQLRK